MSTASMESCRTCSKTIAATSLRCPYCGETSPTKSMYVATTTAKFAVVAGMGLLAAIFSALLVRAIILG